MMPKIAFVGMTHLGLVSAVAAATKGCQTLAVDPDAGRIAALARGELPVVEPGLPELLAANGARLKFGTDPAALREYDLVYIAPDVPVQADGTSDAAPVAALIAWARSAVRRDAVLVVLSQVPPGFTRRYSESGSVLYYQVETLIFGSAVQRALHPERFIIGCLDPSASLPSSLDVYLRLYDCPILPMRMESAELAKISINLCLVAQISVTNTIAELCEGVGADWREIAPALRLDRRIGAYAYLGAGLGVGGGNLLRDVTTTRRLAADVGSHDLLLRAFEMNSQHRRDWAAVRLHSALSGVDRPRVAILGLAYKADTAETLNSPGLALAKALRGFTLRLHDPAVDGRLFGEFVIDPLEACAGCDAVAIMTPWAVYKDLPPARLAQAMRGRTVLDPYGLLEAAACKAAGLRHHVLGVPAP